MLKEVPAVAVDGAVTEKWVAGPKTVIIPDEPVIEDFTVSVATMVWLPTEFKVAENDPLPFVNGESFGRAA
jgi:hypothetical protein